MTPLLSLSRIEHRQGGFCLCIDQLALLPGRMYALAGPNGAGKSTLLRLLALLEGPQQGELCFCGAPVRDAAARQQLRGQVTLLHQSPYLFDGSVGHNVAFGLALRGLRGEAQRRRVAEALAIVGLSGFEGRHARALSGGEVQRVALARALALQPQLLLLDEPTAGLDAAQLPLLEQWLTALPGQGMTLVVATHDAGQTRRLGAEVIHLYGGRLQQPDSNGLPLSQPPLTENKPWPSPSRMQEA